jgi:predicted phosphodiesterase
MRLGVIADIHGNEVALRAILEDAEGFGVDCWWALGDLVLFGPRPVEVLEILRALPGIEMLRGNTDRYVLTGDQPLAHPTAADAVGSVDLVRRFAAMAAGVGWTGGVLDQAGVINMLTTLPALLRRRLPISGTDVLGVHASPGADDGPGIGPATDEARLRALLAGCDADVVIGGHTHSVTDRLVDGIRVLNPGSAGLPREPAVAGWLLLEDGDRALTVTQRAVPFDADAVIEDLRRRRNPNAGFVAAILTGRAP